MSVSRFLSLLAVLLLSLTTVPLRAQTGKIFNAADKYRLFNSSENISSNSVSQLGVNANSGQIWLGTRGGLNVSDNGGSSFRIVTDISRFNRNGVFGLAVKGDSVWASTAYTSDKEGRAPAGDGMMFSLDAGTTWKSVPQPLDQPNDTTEKYGINTLKALPIIVPEQNVIYDLAIGPRPGMVWAATWSGGIRRSKDYGNTWERTVLPPAGKQTIAPTDTLNFTVEPQRGTGGYLVYLGFSVLAASDGSVWAGTVDGLCKSTDANTIDPSWVKFNRTYGGLSGNWVVAIKEQPATGTIWAATWPAEDNREFYGASYTSDGGQTWKTALDGIKLYDFAFHGDTVYAVGPDGLFISPNNGFSWRNTRRIVDRTNSQRFIAGSAEFLAVETESLSNGGTRLWVGTTDGTAISTDGGNSWTILRADKAVGRDTKTYAYPNPFSPKLDNIVRIRYKLEAAGTVTIRIFDFSMNPVCTVLNGAFRSNATEAEVNWDGRTAFGAKVANGVYFYSVEQKGAKTLWGKIMVLE
ncbi:MAG: hypothetical protein HGB11_02240 [Chlorobiales bacterium]|nr:hypothetical protein [Chlorobiales bacterium]